MALSIRLAAASLALLLASSGYAAVVAGNDHVVQTESGAVRGTVRTADGGKQYVSFRGIPYAKPPIGKLRFERPQSPTSWSGVLEARREGPACPQADILYGPLMRPRSYSESCLTINVHVPLHVHSGSMPVLVFTHGGGFGFGSGDSDVYGPEYLVTKGIIVITFNYRLGALGFLSLGSSTLPGNLGLRDMLAALSWVQRNVAAFGGDPDRVTFGGQSAGGVATHLLALSPAAKGLFSKVILMSGVGMRSWTSTSPVNAKRIADNFMQLLNITSSDDETRLRQLRRVSVDRIVNATRDMQQTEGINVFGPVIEMDTSEAIIAQDPDAATFSGQIVDIPMLIGHTDAECHTFARRFREINFAQTIQTTPASLIPSSLLWVSTDEENGRHVDEIVRRYFAGMTDDPEQTIQLFVRYCSDAFFVYPAIELAHEASRHNSAPVFLYEYAYNGSYSPIKSVVSGQFKGAGHIEDMTYLLRTNSFASNISHYPEDERVKNWMVETFSNFIKNGSPACEKIEWHPYEADENEVSLRRDNSGAHPKRGAYASVVSFFRHIYSNSTEPYTDPDTLQDNSLVNNA